MNNQPLARSGDVIKTGDVYIKISDNRERVFIEGKVDLQFTITLPRGAVEAVPAELSDLLNPVIAALQAASDTAAERYERRLPGVGKEQPQ